MVGQPTESNDINTMIVVSFLEYFFNSLKYIMLIEIDISLRFNFDVAPKDKMCMIMLPYFHEHLTENGQESSFNLKALTSTRKEF